MSYDFYMPTRIVSQDESSADSCVKTHSTIFALGKKAVVVCGKHSARACGALDDVESVMKKLGIDYIIYDKVTENPPVSTCYAGGRAAIEAGCDFVIGIGGGSPLDASKAVAVYAANPDFAPDDAFSDNIRAALPIIAIPTTAGTGSEANPFSVMTLDGKNVKKTMKTPYAYPRVSILDPRYTETLSRETTVSTALDAFCHCAESYLSPKSTDISRKFAVDGAKKIYNSLDAIDKLGSDADDPECLKLLRYGLMTGANAGGIAINTTGTGFNHPLGYNLTLYKGIPHGRACGAFMSAYYYYNRTTELGAKLIDDFCDAIGVEWAKVAADIVRWSDVKIGKEYGNALTPDEIELYVNNVKGAGNYKNSPYVINPDEMRDIYQKLFG